MTSFNGVTSPLSTPDASYRGSTRGCAPSLALTGSSESEMRGDRWYSWPAPVYHPQGLAAAFSVVNQILRASQAVRSAGFATSSLRLGRPPWTRCCSWSSWLRVRCLSQRMPCDMSSRVSTRLHRSWITLILHRLRDPDSGGRAGPNCPAPTSRGRPPR